MSSSNGENYKTISQVFRSNIFPYVEQPWSSTTKTTYTSHIVPAQRFYCRQKDWLGRWHENDVHRHNILHAYDESYRERIKGVNGANGFPIISKDIEKKIQKVGTTGRSKQKPSLPTIASKRTKKKRSVPNMQKDEELKLPKLSNSINPAIGTSVDLDNNNFVESTQLVQNTENIDPDSTNHSIKNERFVENRSSNNEGNDKTNNITDDGNINHVAVGGSINNNDNNASSIIDDNESGDKNENVDNSNDDVENQINDNMNGIANMDSFAISINQDNKHRNNVATATEKDAETINQDNKHQNNVATATEKDAETINQDNKHQNNVATATEKDEETINQDNKHQNNVATATEKDAETINQDNKHQNNVATATEKDEET